MNDSHNSDYAPEERGSGHSIPTVSNQLPHGNVPSAVATEGESSNESTVFIQDPEVITGKAEELWVRFWDTGDMVLFTRIVDLHLDALRLSPVGHPHRARALLNLAVVLVARGRLSSEPINLTAVDEIIPLGRQALSLWPTDRNERGGSLVLLGRVLLTRFSLTEYEDVEAALDAVNFYREALPFFPARSSPYREVILDCFAKALQASWRELGDESVLPEAISVRREILSRHPDDGLERIDALHELFIVLGKFHTATQDTTIIDEFIFVCHELQRLLPVGHEKRENVTNQCSSALMLRFRMSGNLEDLEEATILQKAALDEVPATTSESVMWMNELANAHLSRFIHTGNADALADSVALFRKALAARSLGDPNRGAALDNIASALRMHYQQTGSVEYLTEALQLHEEALALHPPGHPARRVSLNVFANGLTMLHKYQQNPSLLDQILDARRECLSLTPSGHPERGAAISNLASAISAIFQRDNDANALSEAISLHREALRLHSVGHPDRVGSIANLVDTLTLRHLMLKNVEDVDEALALVLDEISNIPEGHPTQNLLHSIVAELFLLDSTRFSWDGAVHHLVLGVKDTTEPARKRAERLQASLKTIELASWITKSEDERPRQLLDLYLELISLLPRVAHFGLDASSRLREVGLIEEPIYRMAAFRAIYMAEYTTAVEILEESKSTFWEQTLRLRAPLLDKLPEDEKRELQTLLRQLDQDTQSGTENRAELEVNIEERRRINTRLEGLIDDIRVRPSFERFLKIPLYEELTVAAAAGPVVLLFPVFDSCVAIFIDNIGSSPRCALLKIITARKLRDLRLRLPRSGLRDGTQLAGDELEERGMRIVPLKDRDEEALDILEVIWTCVVRPVMSVLELPKSSGRDRPRLHWIPFGDFSYLPLHAAGIYRGQHPECAADYAVSSYSPSLSALMKSRQKFPATGIPREQLKALLIAEANAPFLDPLEGVEEEVDTIASLALSASVSVINDIGTVNLTETVLDELPSAQILHLACHGCQDPSAPLQSHFALRDGNLDISTLMKLDLPNATLAFLSACETAKGDPAQPDQAVHLAASMLFCGFRSVIATMWAMGDVDGPIIAQKFYEELFSREQLRLDDIPYALDAAVQELREQGASPSRWATFIHMGA